MGVLLLKSDFRRLDDINRFFIEELNFVEHIILTVKKNVSLNKLSLWKG